MDSVAEMATTWKAYEAVVEQYHGPLAEIDLDEITWLPKPGADWSMARQYDYEPWKGEGRWRIYGQLRWSWQRPELFSTMLGPVLRNGKERDAPCFRVRLLGFNFERVGRGYPR